MRFRQATPGDTQALLDIKEIGEGWVPSHLTGQVILAEDDEGIAGCIVVQWMPIIEPIWVRPELRQGRLSQKLWIRAKEFLKANGLRRFYTHDNVTNPSIGRYLKWLGLKSLGHRLYQGEL